MSHPRVKASRACLWLAVVVTGAWFATGAAHSQNADPITGKSAGLKPIPMHPGGGPDPYEELEKDPNANQSALREQEKLNSQIRQKQLTQASDLLLKVTLELRIEMAGNPHGVPTETELQRVQLIQKLAHLIQEGEKAEYQAAATLAQKGGGQ
ncbi:MAG TPA: hypothetical protein VL986_13965 [Terracidiphilus sp.]|nr:hypothetical protein [Terracidiphilus sp.]